MAVHAMSGLMLSLPSRCRVSHERASPVCKRCHAACKSLSLQRCIVGMCCRGVHMESIRSPLEERKAMRGAVWRVMPRLTPQARAWRDSRADAELARESRAWRIHVETTGLSRRQDAAMPQTCLAGLRLSMPSMSARLPKGLGVGWGGLGWSCAPSRAVLTAAPRPAWLRLIRDLSEVFASCFQRCRCAYRAPFLLLCNSMCGSLV